MKLKQWRFPSPSTCGSFRFSFPGFYSSLLTKFPITKFLPSRIFQLAARSSLEMPTEALLTYINSINTSILRALLQVFINTHLALKSFKRVKIWQTETPSISRFDQPIGMQHIFFLKKMAPQGRKST